MNIGILKACILQKLKSDPQHIKNGCHIFTFVESWLLTRLKHLNSSSLLKDDVIKLIIIRNLYRNQQPNSAFDIVPGYCLVTAKLQNNKIKKIKCLNLPRKRKGRKNKLKKKEKERKQRKQADTRGEGSGVCCQCQYVCVDKAYLKINARTGLRF